MVRRWAKDQLKELFFQLYRTGVKLGVYVLPAHYYASEPNIIELSNTIDMWANPRSFTGIDMDPGGQMRELHQVCDSFMSEYVGNATYRQAMALHYGPGFGYIEAQALHAMVRAIKPHNLIEVGSGASTYCSHQALLVNSREGAAPARVTCIEPYPSARLLTLASSGTGVEVIRQPVQQVPLAVYDGLDSGDVLFIDSSHVVRAGSDVNHLILEVLPRLRPGVRVHFHDIYWPYDYQRDVLETFLHNNETPLLTAFLQFNTRFRVLFSLSFLHYTCPTELKQVFPEYNRQADVRGLRDRRYDPMVWHFPSSVWLEVVE